MKVLHLTSHLKTGGITIYIHRLVKPFARQGIESHVFSSGGDYTDAFAEVGAHLFERPIFTKSELHPKIYRYIPHVVRYVREKGINLLHAHTRITQVMAFWISKLTGIPVVTTCHGFYKRRLGRRILPAWGEYAVAISDSVGEHLKEDHHVSPDKICVVNNGVDIEDLDSAMRKHSAKLAKKHFGFHETDIVLGNTARLVEEKGHEYAIRAIPILKKQFPRIRLLIAGDGKHRGKLVRLVQDLAVEESVVFSGNLKDVTLALSAMDAYVFPATWKEGFGLSIVEAMACRVPVVVSNVWCLNALIQDRESGLLVDPKNPDAIASAVGELLKNHDLRNKLTESARKICEDQFSIHRMASDIVKVYARALRRS